MSTYHGDGMLFPPPEKHDEPILAVVVEKKGDETRTSMRQSEIYAYSYDIIIRDGYMVMPKIFWKDFEPGDWFVCQRNFSVDRYGRQKEERELVALEKIVEKRKSLEIPATRFVHGRVQIIQYFMLCPRFIRNREVKNTFGHYRKLYVMYIGQGYVHDANSKIFRRIKPGFVYKGVFEFCAKDNGAVNFGHRHEIRDHTGHVLERDAMWALVKIVGDRCEIPLAKHEVMSEVIAKLLLDAQKFDEEVKNSMSKNNGVREQLVMESTDSRRRSLTASSRRNSHPRNVMLDAGRAVHDRMALLPLLDGNEQDVTMLAEPNEEDTIFGTINGQIDHVRNARFGARRQSGTSDNVSEENSLMVFRGTLATAPVLIQNVEQLNAHRARTIMQTIFQVDGRQVIKWIDRESGETSTDCDFLNYKFDVRHGFYDEPQFQVGVALATSIDSSRQGNIYDVSSFSDVTVSEREPLASSTPRTSPLRTRRQFGRDDNGFSISQRQSGSLERREPHRRRLAPF